MHVNSVCAAISSIQGAYFGITTGLILTTWLGIGAQVYQPPVLGPVPPPMSTAHCPYRNFTFDDATTTYPPELLSTTETNSTVADM